MVLKVLEFFEQRMLQKFLNTHGERLKILGFSAVTNPKPEDPFDPDRFYLIVDFEPERPQPQTDILVSVCGSRIVRDEK